VINLVATFNAPIIDTDKLSLCLSFSGSGSLKRLQAVLEHIQQDGSIAGLLSPLYILYDLRVAYSHIASDQFGNEKLKTATARLQLESGAGLFDIHGEFMQDSPIHTLDYPRSLPITRSRGWCQKESLF